VFGRKTGLEDPVIVVDYDPKWPLIYEEEKARILAVIPNTILAIEHVGSTAVPGLGAKPTIDVMVGINHLSDARKCIEPLRSIGYEYVPEFEASIPERRYFRKGPSGVPNKHFHLHMVEHNGDFWERHILFRDYLRAHPKEARRYNQLKKELAAKHRLNREAYTDAKTSYIKSVVARARSRKPEYRDF
jgi:GrpB-like predicted nucleotidyltransferase (UPF0157 family)